MVDISESSISLSRLPKVKERIGYSRSTIYAMISRGEFPAPISLGGRAVAWIDAEIDDWISERISKSRGGEK